MKLYVAIATVGRPEILRDVVSLVFQQSCPPEKVVIVAGCPADVEGLDRSRSDLEIVFSEKGLSRQRNRALDIIDDEAEIVTFFDDDFIPADDYLQSVKAAFASNPEIVGVTGDLIADGINLPLGYTIDDGLRRVAERFATPAEPLRDREALYGCNMSLRLAACVGLRFDEILPLYSWQEDIDFTVQLGRRGRLVSSKSITGVHLGNKRGRISGKRMGYSQVANIVYLWKKGTMQPKLGEKLLYQNLLSNLVKSVWPEPHIDRRGRLIGNVIALFDWAAGRIDPRRIETM
jgi:hypothetical protein